MLEKSKAYVNNAIIRIYVNYDQFQPNKYGKHTVEKKSKIINRQFNSKTPTFAYVKTSIDLLEDEASNINIGQYTETKYMQLYLGPNEASSWTNFPFQYKFMSFHFNLDLDILHTNRTSYDVLNMLGDVGGVLGILLTMFRLISSPFAMFRLKAILTSRLFNLSAEYRKSIFGEYNLSA